MAKGITNEAERSDSKATKEKSERGRRQALRQKQGTPGAGRPSTRPSGSGTPHVRVRDHSRRAAEPRKSAAKAAVTTVRKDWRQSEVTTFLFGLIIIEGVIVLVSHYSTYKQWMAPVSLLIGMAYALVFTLGGLDK